MDLEISTLDRNLRQLEQNGLLISAGSRAGPAPRVLQDAERYVMHTISNADIMVDFMTGRLRRRVLSDTGMCQVVRGCLL